MNGAFPCRDGRVTLRPAVAPDASDAVDRSFGPAPRLVVHGRPVRAVVPVPYPTARRRPRTQ